MGIFDKRQAYKPFEYDILGYKTAINHSYWIVSEWNFMSDIQDFHVNLDEKERNAIKNTLLAISQIEISVKRFWTKLGDRFPKAEFEQVGVTFGESEVRHAEAYSHLLEVLGLNNAFEGLQDVPAIQKRVKYLGDSLKGSSDASNESFSLILTLFAILIENVSLFSQFLIIKSFNKHKQVLKDVDNVVQATQKEEMIHAMFGIYIVKEIQKEFPEWFGPEFYTQLYKICDKAYKAECEIIDWIFEKGEVSFLPKKTIKEFIKQRINESLKELGAPTILFEIDGELLGSTKWFEDEMYADTSIDFFYKKSVDYSKNTQAYTAEELF